jgi:hypothetical protein
MARGLSKHQIRALQVIDSMKHGGGTLDIVNKELEITFYPKLWFKQQIPLQTRRPTKEVKYDYYYGIWQDAIDKKAKLNKARVTIYKIVNSLIRRRLLRRREKIIPLYQGQEVVNKYLETKIFITKAGKEVLDQIKD